MKNKELDRLGHFMLKKVVRSSAEQGRVKRDIDKDKKLTKKEKNELYSELIDALMESQLITATIMSAAENSDTFRFSEQDSDDMSIEDVAKKLNVNIDGCDECKSKADVEIHKIKMSPENASKIVSILEKMSNKQGAK